MKKLIIIFFSAALGISFLFIGFGSYVSTNHVIKLGNTKITTNEFNEAYDSYKVENEISNLSEDQDLYAKIQFLNEYINELAYEEFLNEKIKIITGKGSICQEFPLWIECNPLVRKIEQSDDGGCFYLWILIKKR